MPLSTDLPPQRNAEDVVATPAAVRESLADRMERSPWRALAIAAAGGYVLGGGLFSRLSRPLARIALGAAVAPRAIDWLRSGGPF